MHRAILRLAIPNILSNISVPLLSTFDTALMGRLSAEHIGAVGLGSMIFNFIYWNFGFLRMGSTGLTAQAYGRDSQADMAKVLGQAATVGFALAILLVAFQVPIEWAAVRLLQVQPEQMGLVHDYFAVRIWGAPAALALYALFGWFFGMQNAVFPLVLTLIINGVNILTSVYFVQLMGLEARGVALGTVIAQYVGLVVGLVLLRTRYPWLVPQLRLGSVLQRTELVRFLRLNGDIFIRTLCLTLGFGFFYNRSGGEGELILATNVILLQYVNWMSYGIDGFAYAAESLVGRFYGASQPNQTKRAITYSFGWAMGLSAFYALAYYAAGPALLRVFTDQSDVLTTATPYLIWMVLFAPLATPCYLWDGVFIGLTASKAMRNTMLLAFAGYLGLYYSLGQWYGNHGLWLSLLGFMVLRGGIQQLWYHRYGLNLR